MSRENVEAVRQSMGAWNRGDVDAWVEASHPDIEWFSEVLRRIEGPETVYRGQAGLRRYWAEWHAVWELTIEIAEMRDLGDTVLTLGQIRTRGEASGVDLDQEVAYVHEFEDGLARRVRSYFDRQEALAAVGLPPA
jgi:ketosteroid isomerase-like protein